MLEFFVTNQDCILSALCCLFAFVGFCVTMIRTGSIKKSLKAMEELNNMPYKKTCSYSQGFSEYEKDYVLNPATNELEELEIPKNVQKYIDSYVDTCLEKALEKFLPDKVSESDSVIDYTQVCDDLSQIGNAMDIAEDYREKFGLPDTYSTADIYAFVQKQSDSLKSQLSQMNKDKEKADLQAELDKLRVETAELKSKLNKENK